MNWQSIISFFQVKTIWKFRNYLSNRFKKIQKHSTVKCQATWFQITSESLSLLSFPPKLKMLYWENIIWRICDPIIIIVQNDLRPWNSSCCIMHISHIFNVYMRQLCIDNLSSKDEADNKIVFPTIMQWYNWVEILFLNNSYRQSIVIQNY